MKKFVNLIALSALIVGWGCSKKDNTITYDRGTYTDPITVPAANVQPYDPTFESKVIIYYPPGYNEADTSIKYPVAYFLHGYGGDYTFYRDVYDLGELMSYMIAADSIEPMILVFINGRNLFYGSFYSNSEYMGNPIFGLHEDYIIHELLPEVENNIIGRDKLNGERYIAGYSMGGYGAFMLAAKYSNLFDKAAALSGPHAFAIFTDTLAEAQLLAFFKKELALDTLIFNTIQEKIVGSDTVSSVVLVSDTVVRSDTTLPLTIDTLFYIFSKPGSVVFDTVISETLIVDTIVKVRYTILHPYGYYPKRFTMYMTALSAAFTPKAGPCAGFDLTSEYIVKVVDTTAGICVGLRLPVDKNLTGLVDPVVNEWISDHDVQQLIQNNATDIVSNGVKWYLSSGTGTGNDLETVINTMNNVVDNVFKGIYGSDYNNFVIRKTYDGSSDPFGFPANHNQYIYQELGEVLKFFGK